MPQIPEEGPRPTPHLPLVALPFSIASAGLALSIVGSIISTISGISIRKKVIEMVTTGLGAAALSYVFGNVIQMLFGSGVPL
ncbi:VIT1/CCC1 transporter family protein [Candidatus Bathyarchaeota archaeon]|nr:VIT1/CCC1 transporter family protein [Candidatus Bathyarchaeota archaeon]